MKITFLGTGTSQGVPVIACDCEVCCSDDPKDKRLRSSVLVEAENQTILIDAGPDFRQQMLRAGVNNLDAIMITHEHKDHIAGLDDIRSFNYRTKKAMPVYCNIRVKKALEREFFYVFNKEKYPGIPEMDINIIRTEDFYINNICIKPIEVLHYHLPVLAFRIEDFAYVTDTNFIPEKSMEKLMGLKILVINALRKKKHISHFNLEEALEIIKILKPEKAYLNHISHLLGRNSDTEKELPENVFLAYDGLYISDK
ncbi:MAG: MBL fold metallo-hydrolase [Bacteroidota bacterium]